MPCFGNILLGAVLLTNFENMNAADFILIQVHEKDKFYELARIRPYEWDKERGWFCEGFGQNNGSFYEFSLHLGKDENDVKHKFINLGYPVKKYDGEKVRVERHKLIKRDVAVKF